MNKYQIVEFIDGTFAVQKSSFFGLFKSYLSKSVKGITWSNSIYIDMRCKVKTIEEAKKVLKLHTKKSPQFVTQIKRIINE